MCLNLYLSLCRHKIKGAKAYCEARGEWRVCKYSGDREYWVDIKQSGQESQEEVHRVRERCEGTGAMSVGDLQPLQCPDANPDVNHVAPGNVGGKRAREELPSIEAELPVHEKCKRYKAAVLKRRSVILSTASGLLEQKTSGHEPHVCL